MSESREKMNNALKSIVVPVLRKKGFRGSFPHFRRVNGKYIDLLTFQFSQWGGEFVVEIGKCSSKGIKYKNGSIVTPEKINTWSLSHSMRLAPLNMENNDKWFVFEPELIFGNYEKISNEVVEIINSQGETWWADEKNLDPLSIVD